VLAVTFTNKRAEAQAPPGVGGAGRSARRFGHATPSPCTPCAAGGGAASTWTTCRSTPTSRTGRGHAGPERTCITPSQPRGFSESISRPDRLLSRTWLSATRAGGGAKIQGCCAPRALDFGDFLLLAVRCWRSGRRGGIAAPHRHHILVDSTGRNHAQHRLLALATSTQPLHRWRSLQICSAGSDIRYLLSSSDYPDARVISWSRTAAAQVILTVANALSGAAVRSAQSVDNQPAGIAAVPRAAGGPGRALRRR
jgi:hypothetical protein